MVGPNQHSASRYLMREAIKGHQGHAEAIGGHQWQSDLARGFRSTYSMKRLPRESSSVGASSAPSQNGMARREPAAGTQ